MASRSLASCCSASWRSSACWRSMAARFWLSNSASFLATSWLDLLQPVVTIAEKAAMDRRGRDFMGRMAFGVTTAEDRRVFRRVLKIEWLGWVQPTPRVAIS